MRGGRRDVLERAPRLAPQALLSRLEHSTRTSDRELRGASDAGRRAGARTDWRARRVLAVAAVRYCPRRRAGAATIRALYRASDAPAGETSVRWPRFDFNHPLFVMFSSGTTGPPKCIVHGAGGTLLAHAKEHRLHVDLRRRTRCSSTHDRLDDVELAAIGARLRQAPVVT